MRKLLTVAIALISSAAVAADKPKKAEKPPLQIQIFLEDREAQIKSRKVPRGPKRDAFLPALKYNAAVGHIGLIDEPTLTVVDVVDAKNMIVEAAFTTSMVIARNNHLENKPRVSVQTIWVRGIDTAPYADGAKLTIDGLVEVTGTEAFETEEDGTATVFVIEKFDRSQLDPYLPPPKKSRKKR